MRVRITIEKEINPGEWGETGTPPAIVDLNVEGPGVAGGTIPIDNLHSALVQCAQPLSEIPSSDLALALAPFHERARMRREVALTKAERDVYLTAANNGRSAALNPFSETRIALTVLD